MKEETFVGMLIIKTSGSPEWLKIEVEKALNLRIGEGSFALEWDKTKTKTVKSSFPAQSE